MASTKSPSLEYAPRELGDGTYCKILRPMDGLHPAHLGTDRRWHNPGAEHVVIDVSRAPAWYAQEIAAGDLIPYREPRKSSKQKKKPAAAPAMKDEG